jgi:prepilin-type N-terminal cleavage/methylation domain-containing protein
MKTIKNDLGQGTSDWKPAGARASRSRHPSALARRSEVRAVPAIFYPPSSILHRCAFTLIELLVVISVIAVLAAFTIPVLKSVKRNQYLKQTQAQMAQIETAIDSYKATYGFYPPGNPGFDYNNPATWDDAYFTSLYFELLGTTNVANVFYITLDHSASNHVAGLALRLGVSGFMNCNKAGAGEDASVAKNFLPDLSPKQYGVDITNFVDASEPVALLLGSAGGPDLAYQPLKTQGVNPWRYVYPGIKNPNSYDLWMQLRIAGTTNLVCNWTKQVELNSPLP